LFGRETRMESTTRFEKRGQGETKIGR